jgi:hypothetical protein
VAAIAVGLHLEDVGALAVAGMRGAHKVPEDEIKAVDAKVRAIVNESADFATSDPEPGIRMSVAIGCSVDPGEGRRVGRRPKARGAVRGADTSDPEPDPSELWTDILL